MSAEADTTVQEPNGAEEKEESTTQSDATPSLSTEENEAAPVYEDEKDPTTTQKNGDDNALTSSPRTENNIMEIEAAQQTLIKQQVEDALVEVHLSWLDNVSAETNFTHRALKRYFADLQVVVKVMRSYAYNEEENVNAIVTAVYEYICKGLVRYLDLLMYWLQENEDNPARKIVEDLLKDYEEKLRYKLDRYYTKAMKHPSDRSIASVSTRATNSSSHRTTKT